MKKKGSHGWNSSQRMVQAYTRWCPTQELLNPLVGQGRVGGTNKMMWKSCTLLIRADSLVFFRGKAERAGLKPCKWLTGILDSIHPSLSQTKMLQLPINGPSHIKMCARKKMYMCVCVYIYNGMLVSHHKKWYFAICNEEWT